MKRINGTYVRALIVGFVAASSMLSGYAFAAVPEIDPGMASGGLTVLGVGIFLLIERYRARR